MALCVYKRIRPDPIRLNLNGKIVIVKGGQSIVADNSQMLGVPGFAFVRFVNNEINFVPAKTNLAINKPTPIIEEFKNPNVIEVSMQNIEINEQPKVSSVSVVEKIELPIQSTQQETKKSEGFSKDIVDKLKSFDNKQWFALKKDEIIKFLDDAGIEYKHISSDKWELLKFLKKLIKEL